jgi:hypothetical protein
MDLCVTNHGTERRWLGVKWNIAIHDGVLHEVKHSMHIGFKLFPRLPPLSTHPSSSQLSLTLLGSASLPL